MNSGADANAASADNRVADDYRARAAAHREVVARVGHTVAWTGRVRLLVFVAGVLVVGTFVSRGTRGPATIAAILSLSLFAWLVARHRRFTATVRQHEALARACDTGAARVTRDWPSLPPAASFSAPPNHAFAADLNLFGDVSLARLLGPVSSVAGRPVLLEWLLAESPLLVPELRRRQQAVAELAPRTDWRERLGVIGARAGHDNASIESFLAWAESDDVHLPAGHAWTARVLAVVTVIALFVTFVQPPLWVVLALLCVINVSLIAKNRAGIERGLHAASARGFSLDNIAAMFAHARSAELEAPLLKELESRIEPPNASAFARLARIAHWGELRFSPMAHAILQMLVLWDIHVVRALDDWRTAHGRSVRAWLRALGELEACSALAALAHDNPAWPMPIFADEESTSIEATALGHPLLPSTTRVANDLTVGPRDTFVLITGSNMAGKSTLLRSIGLNAVLAQVGAPVCATTLRMSRVKLRTSIHIRDALEAGLSLFMAEVLRLKSIVDAASSGDGPMLLYLADEMLHGTNTEERRLAVVAVVSHLLRAGAIGAIATHDTGLADEPALATHARPIYFVEQFRETPTGPEMWFDYRLRPGLATSRNALKLIALVGLTDN
ncbi:MAG TPA: hypothetical protein VN706_08605 [Gemmatimonadaceae bacterium]|nr:hypothetical protein [Gemmatimonadaceae bacterium]